LTLPFIFTDFLVEAFLTSKVWVFLTVEVLPLSWYLTEVVTLYVPAASLTDFLFLATDFLPLVTLKIADLILTFFALE